MRLHPALLGLIFTFRNYGVAAGAVLGAAALSLLELFVAFLQAYIFTLMAMILVSSAGSASEDFSSTLPRDEIVSNNCDFCVSKPTSICASPSETAVNCSALEVNVVWFSTIELL